MFIVYGDGGGEDNGFHWKHQSQVTVVGWMGGTLLKVNINTNDNDGGDGVDNDLNMII